MGKSLWGFGGLMSLNHAYSGLHYKFEQIKNKVHSFLKQLVKPELVRCGANFWLLYCGAVL